METEDTYTPAEAAKIVQLSKCRVTQMLNSSELEGKQDRNGRWQIPNGLCTSSWRSAGLKQRPLNGHEDRLQRTPS
jgi:hypothetical protein